MTIDSFHFIFAISPLCLLRQVLRLVPAFAATGGVPVPRARRPVDARWLVLLLGVLIQTFRFEIQPTVSFVAVVVCFLTVFISVPIRRPLVLFSKKIKPAGAVAAP